MKLNSEDKETIFEIFAARCFEEQKWKWINLKKEVNRIFKAYEELNEQYAAYSYVSRDWYIENMGSKNIHMCNSWEELKSLVNFLNSYKDVFNFLINTESRKSFCIVSDSKELTETQALGIKEAKKLGYATFIFQAALPEEIDFQLLQVRGVN